MDIRKLLIIGELNVDLILNDIKGHPKIGSEIVADTMNFTLGSSSAIMASNIAALGVPTAFCGKIGADDFGKFVLNQLQERDVDTEHVEESDAYKTGLTVVLNYGQDRANVTYCGAMEALTIDDIPWDDIDQYRHLHISNYFLQKGIKKDITEIFERAQVSGLSTSLDLQVDPEEKYDFPYQDCLPWVDIFFPNEAEILALSRKNTVEKALQEIAGYANTIALKMGVNGSRLIDEDYDIMEKAFRTKIYHDAIGAGDSFNAGFLAKYLTGAQPWDCLKFGNLIGAISTTEPGGTAAFSSIKSFEKQIREMSQE